MKEFYSIDNFVCKCGSTSVTMTGGDQDIGSIAELECNECYEITEIKIIEDLEDKS